MFQSISHQPVELIPLKLNTSQCLGLLKESLKSIVHQVPCQPLENEHNGFISFGNEFNNIGFGFVGVVFYKRPSGRLSISVDLTYLSLYKENCQKKGIVWLMRFNRDKKCSILCYQEVNFTYLFYRKCRMAENRISLFGLRPVSSMFCFEMIFMIRLLENLSLLSSTSNTYNTSSIFLPYPASILALLAVLSSWVSAINSSFPTANTDPLSFSLHSSKS